jgi:very-short-patch-repair endonuclease
MRPPGPARPEARLAVHARSEDPSPPRRAPDDRLRTRVPARRNGRTYFFDFAFEADRTILETNGRRWHDDPADYEDDHEKWSVPGRHGYRLVLATWEMVTRQPDDLIHELVATMAPCRPEPIGSVVGARDRESKSPWQLEGALAGGRGDRRRTP